MKKLFSFVMFVLIVFLILTFLSDVGFSKQSQKGFLEFMPGRPPILPLAPGVYLHSSIEYPGVNVSSHIVNLCPIESTWIDLPAKSSFSVKTILITTATLDGASSSYAVDWITAQPDVPRCVGVAFDQPFATNSYHCDVTITGRNARNVVVSETIISSINTVAYTSHAYANEISVVVGEIEYSTSGAVSLDLVADTLNEAGVRLNIATGDAIGAVGKLRDFFFASEDYVQQSTGTYTIDFTYNTITPTNVPNAALDYKWRYFIDSEINSR